MSTPVIVPRLVQPAGWVVWAQWPDDWVLVRGAIHVVDDYVGVVVHLLDQERNSAGNLQILPDGRTILNRSGAFPSAVPRPIPTKDLPAHLNLRARLRWVARYVPVRGPNILETVDYLRDPQETELAGLTIDPAELEVYTLLAADHPFWGPKEPFLEWVQTLPRSTR